MEHDPGQHKYHQHDADPTAEDEGEPVRVTDRAAAAASAMTPEEYVLSSPEAMASAIEQAGE